jgi:recombination protein RecA
VTGADLDDVLAGLNKTYGAGSVLMLGDTPLPDIEAIPSGSLALDAALGVGGYPRGRVIECYGPESSGKTTMALHAIAEAQKLGDVAAFIDAEHALDPKYAAALGVDTDHLIVNQPDSGEQALDIAESLIQSGRVGIIAIDSVAALVPRAEIEGMMGDSHVGLQARLMSQGLRKLTASMASTGTTVIFINQLREKIGVLFGNPETTTGGKALKFYASVRIDVRRIETLKDATGSYGNRVRVKVVKNKVAPPFRQAEFDVIYGQGISWAGELLDIGTRLGAVQRSGAWYTHGGQQIGQGRDMARQYLIAHPDVAAQVRDYITEAFSADTAASASVTAPRAAPSAAEIPARSELANPFAAPVPAP